MHTNYQKRIATDGPVQDKFQDKVRIIVLGDSNVGKTALVHLLCKDKVCTHPASTVGCATEVKIHEHNDKPYFVEILDIGGKPKYKNTRSLFYTQINGIILVHDLTNKNSKNNLREWTNEFLSKSNTNFYKWKVEDDEDTLSELPYGNSKIPVLVIGNKSDLVDDKKKTVLADEDGGSSAHISSMNSNAFSPGTSAHYKVNAFLDKVVQYRNLSNPRVTSVSSPTLPFASYSRSAPHAMENNKDSSKID